MLVTCWKECGHALHHQLALAGGNEGALYFRTQLFPHLARTAPSFSSPQEFHLKSKILSIKQPFFSFKNLKTLRSAGLRPPSLRSVIKGNICLRKPSKFPWHNQDHQDWRQPPRRPLRPLTHRSGQRFEAGLRPHLEN